MDVVVAVVVHIPRQCCPRQVLINRGEGRKREEGRDELELPQPSITILAFRSGMKRLMRSLIWSYVLNQSKEESSVSLREREEKGVSARDERERERLETDFE